MEIKKLLTIFVVFLAVIAATSTVIEAQRGGGHGGGMGGGHHWSVNAGSDNNNVGDNNNAGAIDVYVSTDKRMYVLGEPIEITVTAYNPTESTVTLEVEPICQVFYTIDDRRPPLPAVCMSASILPLSYIPLPPRGSYSWQFTHTESLFPVPVGEHSLIGIISPISINQMIWIDSIESKPITIRVVEPNNGGM